MDPFFIFAFIVILLFSVVLHEVAHGWVADKLGDNTARLLGRITLNPAPHIDILGSFIVPVISLLFGAIIGWAKPVPYNPRNLKNSALGGAIIALAGPGMNLLLALIAGITARLLYAQYPNGELEGAVLIFGIIAFVNVLLAIFNLLPIPPLDGSKVLFALLPMSEEKKAIVEQQSIWLLLFFILLFGAPVVGFFLSSVYPLLVGDEIVELVARVL